MPAFLFDSLDTAPKFHSTSIFGLFIFTFCVLVMGSIAVGVRARALTTPGGLRCVRGRQMLYREDVLFFHSTIRVGGIKDIGRNTVFSLQ